MKHIKLLTGFLMLILVAGLCLADSENGLKEAKSGWNVGGVPAVAYSSDKGFTYGIIVNLFNYGDGTLYPDYLYTIYTELSRTTKGSGINQVFFDSKHILPYGIRITADVSYLTEQALDFYGFNGVESVFNESYVDDDPANNDYISRVYYRHERNLLRVTSDFQGNLPVKNLRWLAGFGHFGHDIGPVDIAALNKGQDEDNKLPDVPGLYDQYVDWGIISADQADGGPANFIKLGAIYDTRDNEANPMKGIWTEGFLLTAPSFMGNDNGSYTQLILTHRQYFTLIPRDLALAVRLGYQGKVQGDIPFYMLPYYINSYQTRDAFGGAKTIRGIYRNRIVGDATAFGNAELRWKFTHFNFINQNFYLALNAFADGGTVLKRWEYDQSGVPDTEKIEIKDDKLHLAYGGGFRIAMNQNFIIAVDYGVAADKNDGASGLYIGLGYLF